MNTVLFIAAFVCLFGATVAGRIELRRRRASMRSAPELAEKFDIVVRSHQENLMRESRNYELRLAELEKQHAALARRLVEPPREPLGRIVRWRGVLKLPKESKSESLFRSFVLRYQDELKLQAGRHESLARELVLHSREFPEEDLLARFSSILELEALERMTESIRLRFLSEQESGKEIER